MNHQPHSTLAANRNDTAAQAPTFAASRDNPRPHQRRQPRRYAKPRTTDDNPVALWIPLILICIRFIHVPLSLEACQEPLFVRALSLLHR
ncbi:hypothetical protein E2542_SST21249 [Spatholobus suberectus]|nr:hypothetical protein E2542_SST21249 [Spatholobus suberectus]